MDDTVADPMEVRPHGSPAKNGECDYIRNV